MDGQVAPRTGRRMRRILLWSAVCCLGLSSLPGLTQEAVPPDPHAADSANGPSELRYVRIGANLDDVTAGRLKNAALSLQEAVDRGETAPLLLLELGAGAATMEAVLPIAEFLASAEMRDVRTVAWVPSTLTGPRVLLALACREIILHPDAEFGNAAEGATLTPEVRRRIERLVERRTNPRVSPLLAMSMIDPATTLLRVVIAAPGASPEIRVVAPEELAHLKDAGVKMEDVRTLKPPGRIALFTGAQAEAEGVLVSHAARGLDELAGLFGVDEELLRDSQPRGGAQRPVLIQVSGEITPLLASYLIRQIERAVEKQADVVIFEIDSPGGYLQESLELAFAIADLQQHQIRTVAYVPHDAVSGAALISLGCDEIYLHDNGKIGDAGPVALMADGAVHRAPEKIVSYLREKVRELAELKRRPEAVLMAMVDRNLSVYQATQRQTGRIWYMTEEEIAAKRGEWTRGPMVPESAPELLLFVNGRRAHDLKIAEPPVQNLDELRERLGIAANVPLTAARRTWLDDTVFILNSSVVTGMLFFLAIILLFVELHFMIGIFGILSALCFGVFFWSKFLGGTAGWLEVMLFLVGLTCLAIEVFVIPGFGVFGVAGGLLVMGALVMAGTSLNDLDRGAALTQSLDAMKSLGVAIICVIGAGLAISHFLPRMPILNAMILSPPNLGQPPASSGSQSSSAGELAGRLGRAETMLRPSGKIRIEGKLLDAVSSAGFIEAGTRVEVVSSNSSRAVVRPVAES